MPFASRRGLKAFALTVGVLATLSGAAIDASRQARGSVVGGGSATTARIVSPTVFASWMSHQDYADGSVTTLLVLWRGSPGWFQTGGGSSSGGGGVGASGFQAISQGSLASRIEFAFDKKTANILNQEVSLEQTNVVLVDFVDRADGPVIVGTRWIEPVVTQPTTPDSIAAVIKQSSELFDYLRCDLSLSDPFMNSMMAIICGQMRPPVNRP